MDNHTAPELLEAVGVDWRADDSLHTWDNGLTSTCHYTGPALGTPELDALLLVAGQRWLASRSTSTCTDVERKIEDACGTRPAWFYLFCMASNPGHALARAIMEVQA